jgi:superfamily II DNA or RNA helicase
MPGMEPDTLHLTFDGGTLVVAGGAPEQLASLPGCQFDPRTGRHRAEGVHYRAIVELIRQRAWPYRDEARAYQAMPFPLRAEREPFPHQAEALNTWWNQGARGVVVLPTGTGKTYLAILAIHRSQRPALVVTPTIDLLNQWYGELTHAFGGHVGLMGGGYHEMQPLTVTTYDSAYIHLERWGNRYGLLIFDECHHLPGPTYMAAATGSIAPFRLGLTATPDRADGQEVLLPSLIGPIVYRREIKQLTGDFLAEYITERVYVELTPEDQEHYRKAREHYRGFVAERGISMGGAHG